MDLKEVRIIKQDERGIIYDCGASSFITRTKGTISANHTHADDETIFLVKGEVELTVDKETQTVKAPIRIDIPGGIYHQLIALTDIDLVIDRSEET